MRPHCTGPFDPLAFLDAAAKAVDLSIPAVHREGVAANLARLYAMASALIDFPFPVPADAKASGEDRERG